MPRIRYRLRIQLDSPILISNVQTVGNYRRSSRIIPGRTLRGAVAAALGTGSPIFEALFVTPRSDEQVYFGSLFPSLPTDDPPLLTPTLFTCKQFPGFSSSRHIDDDHHGCFDTLSRQYAFELASNNGRPPLGFIDELRCPICGHPGETAQEFGLFNVELLTTATTHVAINRKRHVAQPQQLYVREATSTNDTYVGWIDVPESLTHIIEEAFSTARSLQIGANRSRGMGAARVLELEPERDGSLNRRMSRFNLTLEKSFEFYENILHAVLPDSAIKSAQDNRFFVLDLLSPAVLLDDTGIPTSTPIFSREDGSMWATVERQWTSWEHIGGWHAAVGLPRRTHIGVNGVFLCRLTDDASLEELESLDGVGLLREQGYGQVVVCHPIHEFLGVKGFH